MTEAVDTFRGWLRAHPPPDEAFGQTLARVAERAHAGEQFMLAVREFLDEFSLLASDEQRARAIATTPATTGDPRYDAFLGALAEHLAATRGIQRPGWACTPDRFLESFWFISDVPGFRALAIAQSPAAFRRRGVFVAAGALERV